MTEQERKTRGPTNTDIKAAIESLAQAYHQFVQALTAREDSERAERRYLRDRLDAIAGTLERYQRQVDRRFDQVWREIDQIKAALPTQQDDDASNAAG